MNSGFPFYVFFVILCSNMYFTTPVIFNRICPPGSVFLPSSSNCVFVLDSHSSDFNQHKNACSLNNGFSIVIQSIEHLHELCNYAFENLPILMFFYLDASCNDGKFIWNRNDETVKIPSKYWMKNVGLPHNLKCLEILKIDKLCRVNDITCHKTSWDVCERPTVGNICADNNGGCQQLCILREDGTRVCKCRYGYSLQKEDNTCIRTESILPEKEEFVSCDDGWTGYRNGHIQICTKTFISDDDKMNWSYARIHCRLHLGDLLHINSSGKQNIAEQIVGDIIDADNRQIWIGLHRDYNLQWQWLGISNQEVLYFKWDDGQPDGVMEDCVLILDSGQWDDKPCNEPHPFVCQITNPHECAAKPEWVKPEGSSKCYKYFKVEYSWTTADLTCKEVGQSSSLVDLYDATERVAFKRYHVDDDGVGYWIALKRGGGRYWWHRLGEPVRADFTDFDWRTERYMDQQCVRLVKDGAYWEDAKCSEPSSFVCEKPSVGPVRVIEPDVDECTVDIGACAQLCVDTRLSYICSCTNGFELFYDTECKDVNECLDKEGGCEHLCINTYGSFRCKEIEFNNRSDGNHIVKLVDNDGNGGSGDSTHHTNTKTNEDTSRNENEAWNDPIKALKGFIIFVLCLLTFIGFVTLLICLKKRKS